MFFALFILLLVAQPVIKGPDSNVRCESANNQIKADNHKTATQNNFPENAAPNSNFEGRGVKEDAAEKECKPTYNESGGPKWWEIIVAGATCIVAWYAFRQYALSRDNAIRELRAYLSVELLFDVNTGPFTSISDTEIRGPWFIIKNNGKTPAHRCNLQIMSGVGALEPDDSYFVITSNNQSPYSTIHADTTHRIAPIDPLRLQEGQLTHIQRGRAKVYYWGIIRYRDTFKIDRWTRFRMESEWEVNSATERGWLTIPSFTLKGNETDDT